MRRRESIWRIPIVLLVLGLALNGPVTANVAATKPVSPDGGQEPESALASGPVMFIENVGQFAEDARFQMRGGDRTIWLAEDGIWVTLAKPGPATRPPDGPFLSPYYAAGSDEGTEERNDARAVAIRLSFVGASSHPTLEPFGRLETSLNYFIGNEPANWQTNVPVWSGVRYRNLYPGVDLIVGTDLAPAQDGQTRSSVLPWRLEMRKGADLSAIRLRIEGVDTVELLPSAEVGREVGGEGLHLTTAVGEFTLPLLAVEELPLEPSSVEPVNVQTHDITTPFTLAPLLLSSSASLLPSSSAQTGLLYATYLGGGTDSGHAIAVDGSGNAYITGEAGRSFPTTPGAFDTTFNGPTRDAFVAKLSPDGSDLIYATYLGGDRKDYGLGIAVNGSGSAYVTGWTSSYNFPATPGAYDTTYNGGYWGRDTFVAKLSPDGSDLIYATYLGGSGEDQGQVIAVDGSDHAHVTGYTGSSDFPTTPGAFDTTHNDAGDAFVAKLSPDGRSLAYATFLGGSDADWGWGIAVDGSDHAHVTGYTGSSDFPTTPGAFDTTFNDRSDAFVAKLSPDGSTLAYATFLGGSDADYGRGIAVDEGGNAYVTGYTGSSDFPVTPRAYDLTRNSDYDAFVAKLSSDGTALAYATFLGGSDLEKGYGITVDASGSAYVTGYTKSSDFPTTPGAYDSTFNGDRDAFIAKLSPDGNALAYATFLGGSDLEKGHSIAVDASGSAYVTGYTRSSDFPATPGAIDTTLNGRDNVFVAKLAMGGGADTYTISGHVRDAFGAPIAGVTVSAGPGASAITDVYGNYTLRLPAGTYEIRPSKLAYSFTPNSLSVEVARDRTGVSFRGENIACAVPLSEPFLQFPLVEHHTNTMDPAIAVTTAWFDHDTPQYGVNYRVMPYTGELKSDNITGWVGASPCMDGYCYDGHNGYDYPGEDGITPIYAAAEGTVVAVCSAGSSECNDQACGAYGKQLWIDHGNSYATHYAHLHTVYVTMTVGTRVTADTPLGTVGCTGRSTGPHLHFATYFNWNLRDPWITSVTSARPNEVVDPFGWEGLEETPPVYDPWDTPSVYLWEQPLGEARPIDASGGQLASPSGRVFVDMPHGALSETTVMSLRPSPVSAPSATLRGTGTGFWLRALWDLNRSDSTLQAQSETVELAKPITVTMNYTDADLTRLDPTQLAIHRWDEGAKTWQPLPTTLDPVARTATALTDNLGAFDLQAPLICPDAVLEPNDWHATASYLTPNEPIRTLFDIPDDEDWFRFEATEGMTYTIETVDLATGVHTMLEVYDTNAATLLAPDGDGDHASPSRVVWTAPASRSFYVRIQPAATSVTGCDAYYTLRATPHAGELDHQIYLPVVLRSR